MDLLKFVVFSSLEYFSSFIFILVQFRFSLRENLSKILLISILLSFVSYSFIQADLRDISPLVQNAIFLIYIWMVLKVSLPNSIIMLLTGYTVFGLVQTCIIAIFSHIGLLSGELKIGATITYQVQVYSTILMLILSVSTYYLKGGFSFIGIRGRATKNRNKRKYIFFTTYIVISFIITIVINIYLLNYKHPSYIGAVSILLIVLLFLLYLSFKRDESID